MCNFNFRLAVIVTVLLSVWTSAFAGLNINGRLTLGENIADLSGLTVAYDAYLKSLEGQPRPENIDGFTPEQRFFLGWAQVWAGKYTSEAERTQVLGDTHSLPRFRVNGPLSNTPQFQKAFVRLQTDKMAKKIFAKFDKFVFMKKRG